VESGELMIFDDLIHQKSLSSLYYPLSVHQQKITGVKAGDFFYVCFDS
jgi:hypothetical protein